MSLPNRNEIPAELKWDLTWLFENAEACEEAMAAILEATKIFKQNYEGRISVAKDSAFVLTALRAYEQILIKADHCMNYVSLALSVDYADQENAERELRFATVLAQVFSDLSFFESELKQLSAEFLETVAKEEPSFQSYIRDLIETIPHTLSPETERVLSAFRPLFDSPETCYQQAKLADMQFSSFEAGGMRYPLSFVLYENNYSHDTRTAVRREAFSAFSKTLRAYENTVATAYFTRVQAEKTESLLRGYESVLDMLLHRQNSSMGLYNRQIDLIMTHLAPHMRRYAGLLKRYYGLDELRYSDLKLSLDPSYAPEVDVPKAKEYVLEALSVLGPEYRSLVEKALSERRLDFAQNAGKSTGGFCASPYQKGGFILLNWGGELSEVFTLAHELGHLVHFDLAQANNGFLASECSWYLVEAPSTANELLLSNYFLALRPEDKCFKRWVLASMVANTYYHNFVTHLLEAAYQREVYRAVDAGKSLTAADFSALFKSVLEAFWGDSVVLDEGSDLTWMRQPHYYNGLYPYTYSAGLTISTVAVQRMAKEGQVAISDWLRTLKAGGTLRPLDFALSAGVAIDTDQPLMETIAYIGSLIDEIEILLPVDEKFVES